MLVEQGGVPALDFRAHQILVRIEDDGEHGRLFDQPGLGELEVAEALGGVGLARGELEQAVVFRVAPVAVVDGRGILASRAAVSVAVRCASAVIAPAAFIIPTTSPLAFLRSARYPTNSAGSVNGEIFVTVTLVAT